MHKFDKKCVCGINDDDEMRLKDGYENRSTHEQVDIYWCEDCGTMVRVTNGEFPPKDAWSVPLTQAWTPTMARFAELYPDKEHYDQNHH